MSKYTFVILVLAAACGGKAKSSPSTPAGGSCDPVGTWELKFTWEGDAGACGSDVPWDQPFTVNVTKPQDEPTTDVDEQKTPWANTTVKSGQMVGDKADCTIGFVAGGAAGGRDITLNIGPLHQTGNTASGPVELNRPAVTESGEGCSRQGTATATKR
jgi:hypothetical protein